MKNSIIWGSTGSASTIIDDWAYGGVVTSHTVTYSLIEGGHAGTDNISADPLFVSTANLIGPDGIWGTNDDGLQLQAGSPAHRPKSLLWSSVAPSEGVLVWKITSKVGANPLNGQLQSLV